jgi:NAD(P)H-hydrate repair Nnr-like enzyme with NAD(P)H-hydrate dehydratase domain
LSPLDAARTGAYWHGRAGRAAQAQRPRGVVARDVADALSAASVVEPQDETLVRIV